MIIDQLGVIRMGNWTSGVSKLIATVRAWARAPEATVIRRSLKVPGRRWRLSMALDQGDCRFSPRLQGKARFDRDEEAKI